MPVIIWVPSIAPSGMTFYDGDRFPRWKGNLFVGGLVRPGALHRIVFNAKGQEIRREQLFGELKQRIRDVRQGPDGLLYMVNDSNDGVLMRVEPVDAPPARPPAAPPVAQ